MLFKSASANFLTEQPNPAARVTAFFCLSFSRHHGLLQGLVFAAAVSSEQSSFDGGISSVQVVHGVTEPWQNLPAQP